MRRRSFLLLGGMVALDGCVQAPVSGGGAPMPLYGGAPAGAPLPAAAPAGRRVALLAPLTGTNAAIGAELANAAKMALSLPGSPPLDVLDTRSTPAGAAAAAQSAVSRGAGLIIGPLTTGDTAAVAPAARGAGVPVLAFTSDPAQAQPGVWTLGITPAQQIRRGLATAIAQGRGRIGAVLPDTDFGRAMAQAVERAASAASLATPDIRFHDGTIATINPAMRGISGYATRRGPIDAEIRAARAAHTAEGRRRAAELVKTPIPPPPIDILVLADIGDRLATVASLISYYDLDPPAVQVIGPSLWAAPQARGDAPLRGAWYAAPDPAARGGFVADYSAARGAPPSGIADLAFDAAAVARVLAGEGGFTIAALCRPEGFAGVDGLFALQTDGTVRRGLALFRIDRGGPEMIEPPPESVASPGF